MPSLRTSAPAVALIAAAGCATMANGTTQRIPVTSEPAGAQVFVDGRAVGTAPTRVTVSRRSGREIRVEKAGYGPVVHRLQRREKLDRGPVGRCARDRHHHRDRASDAGGRRGRPELPPDHGRSLGGRDARDHRLHQRRRVPVPVPSRPRPLAGRPGSDERAGAPAGVRTAFAALRDGTDRGQEPGVPVMQTMTRAALVVSAAPLLPPNAPSRGSMCRSGPMKSSRGNWTTRLGRRSASPPSSEAAMPWRETCD